MKMCFLVAGGSPVSGQHVGVLAPITENNSPGAFASGGSGDVVLFERIPFAQFAPAGAC